MEWPSCHELPDATYGMWSLLHGKRLVNGSSGFDPPFTQEIRQALARLPDTGVLREPSAASTPCASCSST